MKTTAYVTALFFSLVSVGVLSAAQFNPQVAYHTGKGQPFGIAVADFNSDGIPDIVSAELGSTGRFSLLLGNGDGTFGKFQNFNLPASPYWITTADVNGDGHPDVITATSAGFLYVSLGDGSGGFASAVKYRVEGESTFVIAVDVNHDGIPDLIASIYGSNPPNSGHTVDVLLGNGDGTFKPYRSYETGNNPHSVAVADFNGDGKLDLAVADQTDSTISVLLGNGDGTFQPRTTYPASYVPNSVVAVDLNHDGKVDLVVADSYSSPHDDKTGAISVLLGRGDGTFRPEERIRGRQFPFILTAADFNGDGNQDIAVVDSAGNEVDLLLGNGDGTFQPRVQYPTGVEPFCVIAADLNGDGAPDLAVANLSDDSVSVLLNTGSR